MNTSLSHHAEDLLDVWLVEDNDSYREAIMELIEETDRLQPIAFRSCEEMTGALEEGHIPQVALMDIELPGASGIEGVKRIKAASPTSQIVMLTIHADSDRVFEAICAGASGYMLKSASADELLEAIDDVLRGRAPMDGQIARKMLKMFKHIAGPKGEYDLTDREKEVLELLVEGLTKKQIADRLVISFHTVDTHIRNIYAKLHVHSRSDAVAKALRERLI
jgi:DNA-binding NarL/FixJ family response regulator